MLPCWAFMIMCHLLLYSWQYFISLGSKPPKLTMKQIILNKDFHFTVHRRRYSILLTQSINSHESVGYLSNLPAEQCSCVLPQKSKITSLLSHLYANVPGKLSCLWWYNFMGSLSFLTHVGLVRHFLVIAAHKIWFHWYTIKHVQRHKQRLPLQTALFIDVEAMSRSVKL